MHVAREHSCIDYAMRTCVRITDALVLVKCMSHDDKIIATGQMEDMKILGRRMSGALPAGGHMSGDALSVFMCTCLFIGKYMYSTYILIYLHRRGVQEGTRPTARV